MTKEQANRCLNCGELTLGAFCRDCGQRSDVSRIDFKEIGAQVSSTVFNLEAPLYRTFRKLLTGPGTMTRDFLSGRRKEYYKPVPYFILAVAFHLFLAYLIGYDPIQAVIDSTGGQSRMGEAERKASYWMAKNVNYILPVWVVMISLMDRLFFWRSGFNLAERITAYLFYISQYIILSTLVIALTKIDPRFQLVIYVVMFTYMTYAILKLHGGGFWRGVKAFLLTLISFVFYVILMNVVLIWYFKASH